MSHSQYIESLIQLARIIDGFLSACLSQRTGQAHWPDSTHAITERLFLSFLSHSGNMIGTLCVPVQYMG